MHIAAGIEQVFCCQELGDVAVGKAEAGCSGGVNLHLDLLAYAAADCDGGYAVNPLQGGETVSSAKV